ncbi:hypothetical protein FGB62_19g054 [Gracilaria domingensis]|nr:hypothetical protein FGB62_19g054 [Gracilaria domingensis]
MTHSAASSTTDAQWSEALHDGDDENDENNKNEKRDESGGLEEVKARTKGSRQRLDEWKMATGVVEGREERQGRYVPGVGGKAKTAGRAAPITRGHRADPTMSHAARAAAARINSEKLRQQSGKQWKQRAETASNRLAHCNCLHVDVTGAVCARARAACAARGQWCVRDAVGGEGAPF